MKLDQPATEFTKRELAAIHLCVPDSGNDELDAMIRRAQRERLAGQALRALLPMVNIKGYVIGGLSADEKIAAVAKESYMVADALIAAGEVK